MIIESLDKWPDGVPKPTWIDEVELLSYDEALALHKLGLDVGNEWLELEAKWGWDDDCSGPFYKDPIMEDGWAELYFLRK